MRNAPRWPRLHSTEGGNGPQSPGICKQTAKEATPHGYRAALRGRAGSGAEAPPRLGEAGVGPRPPGAGGGAGGAGRVRACVKSPPPSRWATPPPSQASRAPFSLKRTMGRANERARLLRMEPWERRVRRAAGAERRGGAGAREGGPRVRPHGLAAEREGRARGGGSAARGTALHRARGAGLVCTSGCAVSEARSASGRAGRKVQPRGGGRLDVGSFCSVVGVFSLPFFFFFFLFKSFPQAGGGSRSQCGARSCTSVLSAGATAHTCGLGGLTTRCRGGGRIPAARSPARPGENKGPPCAAVGPGLGARGAAREGSGGTFGERRNFGSSVPCGRSPRAVPAAPEPRAAL